MISWQGCSTEVWYKAVVIVHYFSNQTTDIVTPIIVNQGQHPCSTPNERRVTSSKVFVSYQREFNRMSPRTLIKHDWAVPHPPCAASLSALSLHRYQVAVFHSFNRRSSILFHSKKKMFTSAKLYLGYSNVYIMYTNTYFCVFCRHTGAFTFFLSIYRHCSICSSDLIFIPWFFFSLFFKTSCIWWHHPPRCTAPPLKTKDQCGALVSLWKPNFSAGNIVTHMVVAAARYTGDMSPALPVSVPSIPCTFYILYNHLIHFQHVETHPLNATYKHIMSRWS